MHTLLGLAGVLLVVLGSYLALGLLQRVSGWSRRRAVQMLILAAPVGALALSLGALHHFVGRPCFLGAPGWDYTLGVALPLTMTLMALGGLGLGLVRLVLMARLVARSGRPADPPLQACANRLAARLGTAQPRLRLYAYGRPLALTWGLWRPAVLLSDWMIGRLDEQELEAVLAHELGHVARRDCLVIWLATVLRDAFWYLPPAWAAFRQLQYERELACDELAAGATQRPLALASALAKVWQHAADGPSFAPAPSLLTAGTAIEGRIERLLAASERATSPPRSRLVTLAAGSAAMVGLVALEAANLAVMLAPMGCGPAAPLGRLLG